MQKLRMVVTSDDLSVQTLPLFYKYWKPLKQKHPKLKVTFFVPVNYSEFNYNKENNISQNSEFIRWFNENKSWCDVECHGYFHMKEPENLLGYEEQLKTLKNMLDVMKPFLDKDCYGYKAPYYRMNENTIKILMELGFSWINQWWYLMPLKAIKKPITPIIEFGSHTGFPQANNQDNIDKIYDEIDDKLTDIETINEVEYQYITLREVMKEVLNG